MSNPVDLSLSLALSTVKTSVLNYLKTYSLLGAAACLNSPHASEQEKQLAETIFLDIIEGNSKDVTRMVN